MEISQLFAKLDFTQHTQCYHHLIMTKSVLKSLSEIFLDILFPPNKVLPTQVSPAEFIILLFFLKEEKSQYQ